MKKLFAPPVACAAVGVILVVPSLAGAASVPIPSTDALEGCVIAGTTGGGSCSYTPTTFGGFAGKGNFTLTITQVQVINGTPTTTTTQVQGTKQACATWTNGSSGATYTTVTSVAGTVADNSSSVAFGNPQPSQLEGATASSLQC